MENLEIKLESTVKRIKCNEYGDFITVDVSDKRVFEKFSNLLDECSALAKQYDDDTRELAVLPDPKDEDEQRERVLKICKVDVKYINELIEKLEAVFGKDAIHKVCRDNYENDPYYMPDESILVDFLEAMIPVMEKLFGERYKRNKEKYSAGYRGKNTRKGE